MRFFLDHDVPADLALLLRSRGHDAIRLSEVLPPATPDAALWQHACADGCIVITCNRAHFLALAAATETYPGLIILNRRRSRQLETSRLLTLLKNAGEQGLSNNINFAGKLGKRQGRTLNAQRSTLNAQVSELLPKTRLLER